MNEHDNSCMSQRMIDMFDTLIEVGEYLYSNACENNFSTFENISNQMIEMVKSIHKSLKKLHINTKNIKTGIKCESLIYSITNIIKYSKVRSDKLIIKIKYELIPMLEDTKFEFYFWQFIYNDKDRLDNYYKNDIFKLTSNKFINESEKSGIYKFDLSIIITGYNKVEYTKLCVDNLLKFIPNDISYELILINNGSNDGTKEYFESIAPAKQIDVLENGGFGYGVYRIIEGKYLLNISNDIIITKNSIENMLKCIESDEKIAWIVPTTPNVSNLQTIPANYNTIEEMHVFAEENNIIDQYRWEQRSRLCNPIDLKRSDILCSINGIGWGGYFSNQSMFSFPDDKLSILLRRRGYKMMLEKDAYCYHFGSVTLKDETAKHKDKEGNVGQEAFYNEGRKEFFNAFGIDPWGTGFCWDAALFQYLPCNDNEHVDVLGINCGIGSNPLKVKESIKENAHNLDVTTYNVTDEKCYIEDLKGVSDIVEYINSCANIDSIFTDKKFKYIIFESKLETYKHPLDMIYNLKRHLVEHGIIAIKTLDKDLQNKIKNKYSNAIQYENWIILK